MYKHVFEIFWKIFSNIINVFTVIIDQFNALLMNKSINFINISIYQRTLKTMCQSFCKNIKQHNCF